jgi:hypothetical protein
MSGFWDKLVQHRIVAVLGALSFAFTGGGWLWAWLALKDKTYSLSLHWNNLVHVNQTGDIADLMGLGAFALLVVLLDFAVALELDQRDWFWGKFLASGALSFALLIFIGFAAIISVN